MSNTLQVPERLLDRDTVLMMVPVCRETIRKLEDAGEFPRRRRISGNRIGYLQSEVIAWIRGREQIPA